MPLLSAFPFKFAPSSLPSALPPCSFLSLLPLFRFFSHLFTLSVLLLFLEHHPKMSFCSVASVDLPLSSTATITVAFRGVYPALRSSALRSVSLALRSVYLRYTKEFTTQLLMVFADLIIPWFLGTFSVVAYLRLFGDNRRDAFGTARRELWVSMACFGCWFLGFVCVLVRCLFRIVDVGSGYAIVLELLCCLCSFFSVLFGLVWMGLCCPLSVILSVV